MSSIHGIDTSYGSISDNYIGLSLTCNDTVLGTNINYCNLVQSTKNFVDGDEKNQNILDNYTKNQLQYNTSLLSSLDLSHKVPNTIYDLLYTLPECSEILKLVDYTNLSSLLQTQKGNTLIAPSNCVINMVKHNLLKDKGLLKSLLHSHILDYILHPISLENKLLKINTHNPSFSFISDGTSNIVNHLNFYQDNYQFLLNSYEKKPNRYNVEKIYMTEKGIIYIIDGIFIPENL